MIKRILQSLANKIWPIGEFAQELADELTYNPDSFVMANSVESLIKQGHIHLKVNNVFGTDRLMASSFAYGLALRRVQLHLVDGEDLRVTFDEPPTARPLNWREYILIEQAMNAWLNEKWAALTRHLSEDELERLVAEA
jgi:hypothetical protein